jgi:hypothetical protein
MLGAKGLVAGLWAVECTLIAFVPVNFLYLLQILYRSIRLKKIYFVKINA